MSLADIVQLDIIVQSNAEEQAAKDKALLDEVAAKALQSRNEVREVVRQGLDAIQHMMQGINIAARVLRVSIDPFHRALFTMISTAITMQRAVAAAMATTIVGIPAAVIITAAAFGLQIVSFAEVTAQMTSARLDADSMALHIRLNRRDISSIISGIGGF